MKIVIKFDTDNSAFEDNFFGELEDIFDNAFLAAIDSRDNKIINRNTDVKKTILDSNGNTVGTITVCM